MTPAESYNHLPTNFVLSTVSAGYAFLFGVIDPAITSVIVPIALFAIGKTADILVKVWLEKRKDLKPK
jgi:hypothetical protein